MAHRLWQPFVLRQSPQEMAVGIIVPASRSIRGVALSMGFRVGTHVEELADGTKTILISKTYKVKEGEDRLALLGLLLQGLQSQLKELREDSQGLRAMSKALFGR